MAGKKRKLDRVNDIPLRYGNTDKRFFIQTKMSENRCEYCGMLVFDEGIHDCEEMLGTKEPEWNDNGD